MRRRGGAHRARFWRRVRFTGGALVLLSLVAIGAVAVLNVSADASGCVGEVDLDVAATPEIAAPLRLVAADWLSTHPQVDGHCVGVTVAPTSSPTLAAQLSAEAGGTLDVEAPLEPLAPGARLPDVWVPDSTAWLGRVRDIDRSAFAPEPRSIATSPLVFAMPEAAARRVGWPNNPLQLTQLELQLRQGHSPITLGIADPHRDTAALITTMVLGDALSDTDADLPALVATFRGLVKTRSVPDLLPLLGKQADAGPAYEQAVIAYDATHPAIPLIAVQVEPGQPILDYPYAVRTDVTADVNQAANLFRTAVLDPSERPRFFQAAFRDPEGHTGQGFPAVATTTTTPVGAFALDDPPRAQAALNLWSAVNEPPRAIALIDTTSSMTTRTAYGQTRVAVLNATTRDGFDVLDPDSKIGMWTFGATHHEVLPIAPLETAHRADLEGQIAAAQPGRSDDADLYGAVLDAYATVQQSYDSTRPDDIFVFTDGGDSAPTPERRQAFVQKIETLADPTKPIRIVIIGIDVTPAAGQDLQAIADTVGGGYFPLTAANQIPTIFLKALLKVGEA
jgi:hypothetical protein